MKMLKSRNKEAKLIVLIILLAFLLRLIKLNQSFWLDEAIGALVVREMDLESIVSRFPLGDNHPPLYYMLLEVMSRFLGFSEVALRSLSVFSGVLTVYFVLKIAGEIFGIGNKFAVLFASLLLATSPFHIYYSQEARMYVPAGLFSTAAIYSYIKLLRPGGNLPIYWIMFSFAVTASVFTDYMPVLLLPVFWIYPIFHKRNKRWWWIFVLSHLPLVILGLFWLPTLLHQAERGRWLITTLPAWKGLAGGATLKQLLLVWTKFTFGRITFADKGFYYSLLILVSLPFALTLYFAFRAIKKDILIWLWLFIPLTLGFIISIFFPAFIYFRFVYVLPAFYIIVSRGLTYLRSKRRSSLALSLVLVNILGLSIYYLNPNQHRENWRGAVSYLERVFGDNDVILFTNPEPFAPFRWYEKGLIDAYGATDSISANGDETAKKTKALLQGKKGVYYFSYLQDLHDPNSFVEHAIKDMGFSEKVVIGDFIGVGQIKYFTR